MDGSNDDGKTQDAKALKVILMEVRCPKKYMETYFTGTQDTTTKSVATILKLQIRKNYLWFLN